MTFLRQILSSLVSQLNYATKHFLSSPLCNRKLSVVWLVFNIILNNGVLLSHILACVIDGDDVNGWSFTFSLAMDDASVARGSLRSSSKALNFDSS